MEENLLIPNLENEVEEKNEYSLRPKTLREYSDELYIHTIKEYMKSFSMLDIKDNLVLILPLMGKIIGDYPKDYKEKINEQ